MLSRQTEYKLEQISVQVVVISVMHLIQKPLPQCHLNCLEWMSVSFISTQWHQYESYYLKYYLELPLPARPIKCSDPIFETKRLRPTRQKFIVRPPRKKPSVELLFFVVRYALTLFSHTVLFLLDQ